MPSNNEEHIEEKLHWEGLAEVDDPVSEHGQELEEEDYEEGNRNSVLLDVGGHLLHLSFSQLGGKERRASGMERQGEWEGNREWGEGLAEKGREGGKNGGH